MRAVPFQYGHIYQSDYHGLVRYLGLHDYYGIITHKFFAIDSASFLYWEEPELMCHFTKENMGYHTAN